MSFKFKPGDLVEVYQPGNVEFQFECQPGWIGTIIKYVGTTKLSHLNIIVHNAWDVQFKNGTTVCDEGVLRLVPGGDEYRDTGKWDDIPYVGELFKKSKEKQKEPSYDF
jgi:hypothetical protein